MKRLIKWNNNDWFYCLTAEMFACLKHHPRIIPTKPPCLVFVLVKPHTLLGGMNVTEQRERDQFSCTTVLFQTEAFRHTPFDLPGFTSQFITESLYRVKAAPNCVFLHKEADAVKTVSTTQLVQAS